MRVVFCWTDISGYMGACWRAFAAYPGVEHSHVIAWKVGAGEKSIAFSEQIMHGTSCDLLDAKQRQDEACFHSLIQKHRPDVIVLPGWFYPMHRKLPFHPAFGGKKFVMTMDTPFTGSWRQRLGRLKVGRYLDRMDGVVCGGERSYQLAKFLKIPEAKLLKGMYGFDSAPLQGIHARRTAQGWPRKFVYVGRYVHDKAIDVLIEGYKAYCSMVQEPWPLACHGRGVDQPKLHAVKGVTDHGFVQPEDLASVFAEAGVYVIASRYEPWGVSIAEAAYSGLPILCTQACGAAVEVLRHLHSGYICATDAPMELARGMRWMHEHHARLHEIGGNGIALARPFDMTCWAERWYHFLSQTVLRSGQA